MEVENLELEEFLLELDEEDALLPGTPLETSGSQEKEVDPGLLEDDPGNGAMEKSELDLVKSRVKEMEEETAKLKELQKEAQKLMKMYPAPGNAGPGSVSIQQKMEADARSIYVGNVDYGATAQELENHFHGCGPINRVTILYDKFTGHPKGFAYIEFFDKDSVKTSMVLDDSLFRGRQIKVTPKRTNLPGISTTNRGFPRARYRARAINYGGPRSGFYGGFNNRSRGQVYRGRGRATSSYFPY